MVTDPRRRRIRHPLWRKQGRLIHLPHSQFDHLSYEDCLAKRASIVCSLEESPYSVHLHTRLALCYFHLQYPDLAAGSAYKALLLSDAVADGSDEYHEPALQALKEHWANGPDELEPAGQEADERANDGDSAAVTTVQNAIVAIMYVHF